MAEHSKSLSVVMPALNEAQNITAAVETTRQFVSRYFDDWEILIFNDGSQDRTGEIAEALAKEDPRLKVTHHDRPKNLGGVYKAGIQLATKEFLVMIPGDNENGDETLGDIFSLAGQADMIIPYVVNPQVRGFRRRALSKGFVLLTNLISGNKIRYYNGTVLHRTELLKGIRIDTDSFGYQAEAIVKLLRKGHSFKEVGIYLARRPEGASKALRPKNVIKVLRFLSGLASKPGGKRALI